MNGLSSMHVFNEGELHSIEGLEHKWVKELAPRRTSGIRIDLSHMGITPLVFQWLILLCHSDPSMSTMCTHALERERVREGSSIEGQIAACP